MIKLIDDRWVDDKDNNSWSAKDFTEKQVEDLAKSVLCCKDCKDSAVSYKCEKGEGLVFCCYVSESTNCVGCVDCADCHDCKDLWNVTGARNRTDVH